MRESSVEQYAALQEIHELILSETAKLAQSHPGFYLESQDPAGAQSLVYHVLQNLQRQTKSFYELQTDREALEAEVQRSKNKDKEVSEAMQELRDLNQSLLEGLFKFKAGVYHTAER